MVGTHAARAAGAPVRAVATTSRLRVLACGVVLGVLLGLSLALFIGNVVVTRSDAKSGSGSGSGSDSGRDIGQALIRGTNDDELPSLSPPQAPQARQPDAKTLESDAALLKGVAWAAHDPLTRQIATDLWLRRDMKVYILPAGVPRESKYVLRKILPGLLDHPRVVLTTNKTEADVFISIPFFTADSVHAELTAADWAKTIVIDETDGFFAEHKTYRDAKKTFKDHYLAFFKRSFVRKTASRAHIPTSEKGVDMPPGYWPYNRAYYPLPYAVEDQHLRSLWDAGSLLAWDDGAARDVPVFSSHRAGRATFTGGRGNVTRWLEEMGIEGAVVGDVDMGTRLKGGDKYWDLMRRARIVATANPGGWEGDFRLWEALASKALVFVDTIHAPMPCRLIDGEDLVFFDPYDRADFERKLRYYLEHAEEARRIAMSGFYKALRCHRWINRVDYIMSTAAFLLDPGFKESAIYMKDAIMRTSGPDFYAGSKRARTAPPAADGPAHPPSQPPAAGGGDGDALIEPYRTRIAAKVRDFEDAYWEMVESQNVDMATAT